MRNSKEVHKDLENLRKDIVQLMSHPDALLLIDLDYLSQEARDLKQELRRAKARESVL